MMVNTPANTTTQPTCFAFFSPSTHRNIPVCGAMTFGIAFAGCHSRKRAKLCLPAISAALSCLTSSPLGPYGADIAHSPPVYCGLTAFKRRCNVVFSAHSHTFRDDLAVKSVDLTQKVAAIAKNGGTSCHYPRHTAFTRRQLAHLIAYTAY